MKNSLNEGKMKSSENPNVLCAVFDMQQVICIPICKDSAIFYISRLSVFHFTFSNVATKQLIRDEYPLATLFHRSSHKLNLVVDDL